MASSATMTIADGTRRIAKNLPQRGFPYHRGVSGDRERIGNFFVCIGLSKPRSVYNLIRVTDPPKSHDATDARQLQPGAFCCDPGVKSELAQ